MVTISFVPTLSVGMQTDATPPLISSKIWYNLPMRLIPEEQETLKQTLSTLSREAKLYLFGSYTDDTKRGSDIDLLVISNKTINMKGC